MDLVEKLRKLSGEVEWRLPAAKRSEASTSQFLVMPFFDVLGFNVHNPNHVEPEFTADVGIQREKVDFALKQDGNLVALVEVKYAGGSLDNQHAAQLRRYFSTKLEVRFGILTNGLEFRFFSDLENQNVMDDEPFLTLDLQHLNESLLHVLEQFSRTRFEKDTAIQAARSSRDRLRVRRVLKAEFEPLSHRTKGFLVELIQPGKIEESRRIELTRLVDEEWQSILGLPTIQARRDDIDGRRVRPVSADVLEIPVFADYKGRRFKATLMIDESMWLQKEDNMLFDGKPMNHAVAAYEAVKKVDPLMKTWPTGWIFWHFTDSDTGEERPIKDIFEDVWTRNSSNGY